MKINLEILDSAYIFDKDEISELNTKTLVPKMVFRRRLTRAAKIIIYLADKISVKDERIIYGSNFGELLASSNILKSISKNEAISPTAFQNSVYNTAASYLSMLTENKNEILTISSGDNTSLNVLKTAAIKALDNDTLILFAIETLNIDNINQINNCIDMLECGVALKVRISNNEKNLEFNSSKNENKIPLSILSMFTIAKQYEENNLKNTIEIIL